MSTGSSRTYVGLLFPHDAVAEAMQYIGQGPGPQPLGDVDDVREAFHEHREFLITSMLEDQEGLNWDQSPMLNYFTLTFPVSRSRYSHPSRQS